MTNYIKKIFKVIDCLIKYVYYRCYCSIYKIRKSNIWLISERGYEARDNSYHFYRYLKENHPEINVRYVISKNSPDIDKIVVSDIVYYGSKMHYILFLTSELLISTHIMGYSPDMSLFWRLDKYNLLKIYGKRIFLQHGVIQNYMPSLSKKTTKLDLFITSARKEYEYILENYGYDESNLKCTGLARYDKLINNEKNQILIMPTFRKWLCYTNDFTKSDYFVRWNSLLNNEKLISYLEKNNLMLYFYPHFEMQKYLSNFNSKSKNVVIASIHDYDVQKLLIESKLLVTDYSSIFFDFAYMKKPIVYYQFDKEKFRSNHYNKGYFDYQKDGFGPVRINENDVVKDIINFQKKYLDRVDSFFIYNDANNCNRIYKEIVNLIKVGDSDEKRKRTS